MNFDDLLDPDHVVLDLVVPDKDRLLRYLADRAGAATGLDTARILAALKNRETLGSTGIGNGIALPHASVASLTAPFCMLVRLATPLDFDAIDDKQVDIIFLLLNRPDGASADLSVLAMVARQLRSPAVLAALRSVATQTELSAALRLGL